MAATEAAWLRLVVSFIPARSREHTLEGLKSIFGVQTGACVHATLRAMRYVTHNSVSQSDLSR
jgi:hypothetical protein